MTEQYIVILSYFSLFLAGMLMGAIVSLYMIKYRKKWKMKRIRMRRTDTEQPLIARVNNSEYAMSSDLPQEEGNSRRKKEDVAYFYLRRKGKKKHD